MPWRANCLNLIRLLGSGESESHHEVSSVPQGSRDTDAAGSSWGFSQRKPLPGTCPILSEELWEAVNAPTSANCREQHRLCKGTNTQQRVPDSKAIGYVCKWWSPLRERQTNISSLRCKLPKGPIFNEETKTFEGHQFHHVCVLVLSCSVVSYSLWLHGL